MRTLRGMFELQVRNSCRSRQAVIQEFEGLRGFRHCGDLDKDKHVELCTHFISRRQAFFMLHNNIRCNADHSGKMHLQPAVFEYGEKTGIYPCC